MPYNLWQFLLSFREFLSNLEQFSFCSCFLRREPIYYVYRKKEASSCYQARLAFYFCPFRGWSSFPCREDHHS
nr:MAG TPA: hypothetical protein [Caudoviricetes sp.]